MSSTSSDISLIICFPFFFVIATAKSPVLPQSFHLRPHLFTLRNFFLPLTLLQEFPLFMDPQSHEAFPPKMLLSTSFSQFFYVSRNRLPCLSFKPLLGFFFYSLSRLPMLRSHGHVHSLETFEGSYAYLHQLCVFNWFVCQTPLKTTSISKSR